MKHIQIKSRRNFIKNTAAGTAAITLGLAGLQSFAAADDKPGKRLNTAFNTGFDQQPLPYKYDALEDVIDTMTMEIQPGHEVLVDLDDAVVALRDNTHDPHRLPP